MSLAIFSPWATSCVTWSSLAWFTSVFDWFTASITALGSTMFSACWSRKGRINIAPPATSDNPAAAANHLLLAAHIACLATSSGMRLALSADIPRPCSARP